MNIDEVIDELLEADDTDTDTKYHHHAVAKQTEHQAGPETTHSVGGRPLAMRRQWYNSTENG